MRRILGVSAATLLLASCGGPDAEGTIETEDGDVTYSVDGDGDEVNIDMTGPDGEQVSIRSGAKSDLPDGFSVYQGATVVTSAKIDTADGNGAVVVLSTDAAPGDVIAFYREQAEAADVEIESEITVNGMQMIGGEGPDGLTFSASASLGDDGATTVQLTVGRGL